MRLTAEISTEVLAKLVSALPSSSGEIVLHFSEGSLSICIPHDSTQIGVWAGCEVAACFNKYDVQSKNSNTVSMKLSPSQFAQALILETSPSIQVFLTRNGDTIFLQFTHKSLDALKQLEQRVPILLLIPSAISQYAEPNWEPASMCVSLPPIKSIMDWCKKAKNISNQITLSIVHNSEVGGTNLILQVENEVVIVSTTFFELQSEEDDELSKGEDCSVLVDLKKFIKILKIHSVLPTIALLYIVDKKYIRMHFEVPSNVSSSISLTYFLNASAL
ncbi:Hus1-like protein [Histomonas meleagridis]|uniref:Hus1-like protein n=1 Tax=Histomonas meleagridis TaxID=135588 RepID=UPI00355A31EE|nr:Hus1-like protein [Histomonas meleagridis]KAH0799330.1 Hus1-like protein [Histomonas meleagridis]